jgi:hypothetical protein
MILSFLVRKRRGLTSMMLHLLFRSGSDLMSIYRHKVHLAPKQLLFLPLVIYLLFRLMITLWRPCALQCLIPMGGGHFQNTMHLRSYVWLLDLHSTSANQSKRFSYVKSTPCILKWGCRSSQLLQFAGFSIMICRHLAHCKYLAGPSTLVFLAGCKPPHFCCFFSYCSEQLAYIFHVPNKLKIILLSGIMF